MTTDISNKKLARIAGLLYLMVVLTGIFSLMYVPSKLIVSDNGMRIVHIFSGLWLFPFGYLVYKSSFLPKILGALLMLGCFGYLINFLGYTLIPNYSKIGISSYISLPVSISEIGICLWLLIMSVKDKKNLTTKTPVTNIGFLCKAGLHVETSAVCTAVLWFGLDGIQLGF